MARKELSPRACSAIECVSLDVAEWCNGIAKVGQIIGEAGDALVKATAAIASVFELAALDEIERSEWDEVGPAG